MPLRAVRNRSGREPQDQGHRFAEACNRADEWRGGSQGVSPRGYPCRTSTHLDLRSMACGASGRVWMRARGPRPRGPEMHGRYLWRLITRPRACRLVRADSVSFPPPVSFGSGHARAFRLAAWNRLLTALRWRTRRASRCRSRSCAGAGGSLSSQLRSLVACSRMGIERRSAGEYSALACGLLRGTASRRRKRPWPT